MQTISVPASFVQSARHVSKSARFVPVQPSGIAEVLAGHGFRLGHLKASHARLPERADYQTTIARYVAEDSTEIRRVIGDGSTLDILVRAPHLTGAIEFRLGFFRGACANQWNAGRLVSSVKISHVGNCLEEINRALPQLIGQQAELTSAIVRMSDRQLTAIELAELARSVAELRLAGADRDSITRAHAADLLIPRRHADRGSDLFSAVNVIQENALRYGLRYEAHGPENSTRRATTRKIVETSGAAMDLTGNIWAAASALLAQ